MKKLDLFLAMVAMVATVGCNRLFSLAQGEKALAAPQAQEADNSVYLPSVQVTFTEAPCFCPIIDGVCRCVPFEQVVDQATPEPPGCRPPCVLVGTSCVCLPGVAQERHTLSLPIVGKGWERCAGQTQNGQCCPGRWVGDLCVIGP